MHSKNYKRLMQMTAGAKDPNEVDIIVASFAKYCIA
jgi:hypothetical protein